MEQNNQHKRYRWTLQFDEIKGLVPSCDECPSFVNEENVEVWRRYLNGVVKKHFIEEAKKTSEFLAIEKTIIEERNSRIKWEERRKQQREVDHYRRQMERPKIDFIPRGLMVDYEKEYAKYFMQEVTFVPKDNDDFVYMLRLLERWHKKSIPQILAKNRPDAAYAIAIGLCEHLPLLINRDDLAEEIKSHKPRIGKLVVASYSALAETVKVWNNEEKRKFVCQYITKHAKEYYGFRGMEKKLMALIPTTPFQGEAVAVTREPFHG